MGRVALVLVVVVVGGLATALAAGAAKRPPDYSKLIVRVGKQSVEATLGAYCHPTADGSGRCADAKFPLKTTGTVKIARNGTVELLFGANASYVQWRAARIDGRGQERILAHGHALSASRKSFKRWRFKLPKKLARSTDLLGFSVNYPYAYSSFEVGAKLRRR